MVRKSKFKYLIAFFTGVLIASLSHLAQAQVLFEGYSKVLSGKDHVGYSIVKYEFDKNKKQFISTTFLKTNEKGGNLTESLKAYSTEDLKPLSYQYTNLQGAQAKTIDAKVEKGKLIAVIQGAKKETITKDLGKGKFFSTFLSYVMLRSPEGFKADTKYEYEAIAEEDAAIYKGITYIKNLEENKGMKALKVLNEFKDIQFLSYVTPKGETISTSAPSAQISSELVATASEATGKIPIPSSTLKKLFGEVPAGLINPVSEAAKSLGKKSESAPAQDSGAIQDPPQTETVGSNGSEKQSQQVIDSSATKKEGVAPGHGIQVKPKGK